MESAMNKPYQQSRRSKSTRLAAASTLATILAMAISTSAHADASAVAEYRCSTPGLLTLWEKRACDLARQNTPDELIRFVHSINRIGAGLNVYAYVSDADDRRWDVATRREPLRSADASGPTESTRRAD
jgi:hypothetical protein